MAVLALVAACAAQAETVQQLNAELNNSLIPRTWPVEAGVYVGVQITGQYNAQDIVPADFSAPPVLDKITLTDTPVTAFFGDTIVGDAPITLSLDSYAVFILCTFIDTPPGGPDLVLNDTSRVQLLADTFVAPPPPIAAPEPSAWSLMLIGFAFLGSAARARRKAA